MNITVHKFGGASLKNPENIKTVINIIKEVNNKEKKNIIVVSAFGKTTNALEQLVDFAVNNEEENASNQLNNIWTFYQNILGELFSEDMEQSFVDAINNFFKELHRIITAIILLKDSPPRIYDRVMSYGELLSSTIINELLQKEGLNSCWLDARKLIITDTTYKHARVIWEKTEENVLKTIPHLLEKNNIIIVPGYIAGSLDGRTTTLGREGSDYTAAILSNILNVNSLTLWKDVDGIFPKNPHKYEVNEVIKEISYDNLLKMSFYGAKVVHPRTIAPLKQKNIPLFIKSFKNPENIGTKVSETNSSLPEILTELENKMLIVLYKKNFDYITPKNMLMLLHSLDINDIVVYQCNLVGNEVILILDYEEEAFQNFYALVQEEFSIKNKHKVKLSFYTSSVDEEDYLFKHKNMNIKCGKY